jgi:hypothetical protein
MISNEHSIEHNQIFLVLLAFQVVYESFFQIQKIPRCHHLALVFAMPDDKLRHSLNDDAICNFFASECTSTLINIHKFTFSLLLLSPLPLSPFNNECKLQKIIMAK